VAGDGGEAPPPDLPCGGADLLTDDANCGACGNACDVVYSESPYSSGHCIDGECGPSLVECGLLTEGKTCAEICQSGGQTCVPRGCPGVKNEWITAVINNGWDGPCLPDPPEEEFTLDCDERFPEALEYISLANCCCL
jgi:hypothetical protein